MGTPRRTGARMSEAVASGYPGTSNTTTAILLLDTNVWLDNYIPTRPGHETARRLLRHARNNGVQLVYAVGTIKDAFYLVSSQQKGPPAAYATGGPFSLAGSLPSSAPSAAGRASRARRSSTGSGRLCSRRGWRTGCSWERRNRRRGPRNRRPRAPGRAPCSAACRGSRRPCRTRGSSGGRWAW